MRIVGTQILRGATLQYGLFLIDFQCSLGYCKFTRAQSSTKSFKWKSHGRLLSRSSCEGWTIFVPGWDLSTQLWITTTDNLWLANAVDDRWQYGRSARSMLCKPRKAPAEWTFFVAQICNNRKQWPSNASFKVIELNSGIACLWH